MLHNICQSQKDGMALGMGVRELSGSVLGLMTGAKLLQVGLCYTGSRDYLVHTRNIQQEAATELGTLVNLQVCLA